jgi:hypothetical protein
MNAERSVPIAKNRTTLRICEYAGGGDLNPHALRHQILSLACLPISPPPPTVRVETHSSDSLPHGQVGQAVVRSSQRANS